MLYGQFVRTFWWEKFGIGWKELLKVWYKTKWQVGTESNFVLELCARTRVVNLKWFWRKES